MYNNYKSKVLKEKDTRKTIFLTQENERTRIAKDLHDHIGGMLSSVKIQNELIRKGSISGNIRNYADTNSTLIDQVVIDLRTIVRNQASQFIIDNGFEYELRLLCDQYSILNKIKMSLEFNHRDIILKNDFAINLFRVFQEMMHNTAKYAECTEVTIRISINDGMFHAFYADNGKGFNNAEKRNSGMGVKNIDTRIKLFEGSYQFKSQPGLETSYSCSFRLKDICEDKKLL
jgi:signal transduction histidine kinase